MTLVVIKVGGEILQDEDQTQGLAANVKELLSDNVQVVIVHGGGPQISALQEKVGLKPNMIAGRRVTKQEDLVVVEQAVCGEVNVGLVSALLAAKVRAFGFHGASAAVIRAEKREPIFVPGVDAPVDYGEVGEVKDVDKNLLMGILALGVVPVIATLGASDTGRIFNVNGDTAAAQVAASLKADVLLLVTAVGGVFKSIDDKGSRIPLLTPNSAIALMRDKVITGGMIPKVQEALSILTRGVGAVSILGVSEAGAFRSAVKGDGVLGTRFQPDANASAPPSSTALSQ